MRKCLMIILTVLLMAGVFQTGVNAETTDSVTVGIHSISGYQGDTIDTYIYLENYTDLGSVDIQITYDVNVLECTDITKGWMLPDNNSLFVSNYDNEKGILKLAFVNTDGISGVEEFACIRFTIKRTAFFGTSNLTVSAVNASASTGAAINTVTSNGTVYIYERNSYAHLAIDSNYSVYPNQSVTTNMYIDTNWVGYCAGDIEIKYDNKLLDCIDLKEMYLITENNAMSSYYIDEKTGIIRFSFVSQKEITYSSFLASLTFRVKANAAPQTTTLDIQKFILYDANCESINVEKQNGIIQILQTGTNDVMLYFDHAENQELGKEFTTSVNISPDSNVGAMDFEIDYNASVFNLRSATQGTAAGADTLMIINTKTSGKVIVSLANSNGIKNEGNLLNLTFNVNETANINTEYTIQLTVKSMCDTEFVTLNPITSDMKIFISDSPDDTPIINFKSQNLKEYLINYGYDKNDDGEISQREMRIISELNIMYVDIEYLDDIAHATNLTRLTLYNCGVSDISLLAQFTSLQELYLYNNQISDLSPLSTLTELRYLHLSNNQISSLSPLSTLTSLYHLDISNNNITDINALTPLINLSYCYVYNNYIDISAQAFSDILSTLESNNCYIYYDNQYSRADSLTISKTKLNMNPGDKIWLDVTIQPSDGYYKTPYWTSSNEEVAVVSYDGWVTAQSPGTAVITVVTGLKEAACIVSVASAQTTFNATLTMNTLTIQGANVTGELNMEALINGDSTVLCIISLYDAQGKLLDMQYYTELLNSGTNILFYPVSFDNVQNPEKIKILFWKDFTTMSPLTAPIEITLSP